MWFFIIGFGLVAVDLIMTVRGKPLFKPGPIARLGYPNLDPNDGYI